MAYTKHYLRYCKENNVTPREEWVVCAANRLIDGTIVCGARHWDVVMDTVVGKIDVDVDFNVEQGFINQFGTFLSREEALQVVLRNGQPFDPERNGSSTKLYSEGMY